MVALLGVPGVAEGLRKAACGGLGGTDLDGVLGSLGAPDAHTVEVVAAAGVGVDPDVVHRLAEVSDVALPLEQGGLHRGQLDADELVGAFHDVAYVAQGVLRVEGVDAHAVEVVDAHGVGGEGGLGTIAGGSLGVGVGVRVSLRGLLGQGERGTRRQGAASDKGGTGHEAAAGKGLKARCAHGFPPWFGGAAFVSAAPLWMTRPIVPGRPQGCQYAQRSAPVTARFLLASSGAYGPPRKEWPIVREL